MSARKPKESKTTCLQSASKDATLGSPKAELSLFLATLLLTLQFLALVGFAVRNYQVLRENINAVTESLGFHNVAGFSRLAFLGTVLLLVAPSPRLKISTRQNQGPLLLFVAAMGLLVVALFWFAVLQVVTPRLFLQSLLPTIALLLWGSVVLTFSRLLWGGVVASKILHAAAFLVLGAFLITLLGSLSAEFWYVLSQSAVDFIAAVLPGVKATVSSGVPELTVGRLHVKISSGCAGFEGLGYVTVLFGFLLFLGREQIRLKRAVFLFVPLWTLTLACNYLRLLTLAAIGGYISPDLAMGTFHSSLGWLIYGALAVGFGHLAMSRRFSKEANRDRLALRELPTLHFLLPLMIWMLIGMLTQPIGTTFQWLYSEIFKRNETVSFRN